MKSKPAQSKLAELHAKNGVRYKWLEIYPPFPVRLAPDDPGPLSAPIKQTIRSLVIREDGKIQRIDETVEALPDVPQWVNTIRERVWEILLPVKKGVSMNHYEGAMIGYAANAISRECISRSQKLESLAANSSEARAEKEIVRQLESVLAACKRKKADMEAHLPLRDAADWLKGFAHGEKCQCRESGHIPSSRDSAAAKLSREAGQIYEALLRNWKVVDRQTTMGRKSEEIAKWISRLVIMPGGMSKAELFKRHPNPNEDGQTLEGAFIKHFQTICLRIGVPLRPRGRPRSHV